MNICYEFGKVKQAGDRAVMIQVRVGKTRIRLNTFVNLEKNEWTVSHGEVRILNYEKQATLNKLLTSIDDNLKAKALRLANTEISAQELKTICTGIRTSMSFFAYCDEFLATFNKKGKKNYKSAVNKFKAYVDRGDLAFHEIDTVILIGFRDSMNNIPRAQSLYMSALKYIWKTAEDKYKDLIPRSPFSGIEMPKQKARGKRAITVPLMRKIFEYEGTGRAQQARDCFVLSFCLMGINAADLYYCTDLYKDVLSYDRVKTKDRREDRAHMEVNIHPFIKGIVKKYRSSGKNYVFNFHSKYSDHNTFTTALNKGLKKILGQNTPVTFYSARHTWATVARNMCGANKYDVNEGLVHKDPDMDITDLYIMKDYTAVNELNKKVIEKVFPEAKDM